MRIEIELVAAKKRHPSAALLRALLAYDHVAGTLIWLPRPSWMFIEKVHPADHTCRTWNARYSNKPAFASKNGHGYFQGSIFKRKYEAHRVIYALIHDEWPENVDHQDGNIENNRISNLVGTTHARNQQNLGIRIDNKSGVAGVNFERGMWRVQIHRKGKGRTVGWFDNFEDAVAARRKAEQEYGFHPNHGARLSTAARAIKAQGAML